MIDDHFKALTVQAADDCLKVLMEDADLDVGAFFESWATEHEIPQDQLSDFVICARQHLATVVALSALADKAIITPDMMPSGLDSEDYTARRTYGLHSKLSTMFERRRPKAWEEPNPSSLEKEDEGSSKSGR